jgi:hypothetical protein
MNTVYGLLGFFFFISVPSVLRLSHWAYVDLGVTFMQSLRCSAFSDGGGGGHWPLGPAGGLIAGFAVATKPNGLVAWLLLFFFSSGFRLGKPSEASAGSSLNGYFRCRRRVAVSPLVRQELAQTGNPFFRCWAVFSAKTGVQSGKRLRYLGSFQARASLRKAGGKLRRCRRLFFFGRDDTPYFDGVLSPLDSPAALPSGQMARGKKLLMGFTLLFLLYALFLVDLRVRHILPIVPPGDIAQLRRF